LGLLLINNADVNAKGNNDTTPLHWAACYGHGQVVEFLLANKAAVNAKDISGSTPLHWAATCGQKEIVELLRKHGGHE
jgi:ankyrin repeat protein